jgi:DNA-binding CsgD family transcriptional regulator
MSQSVVAIMVQLWAGKRKNAARAVLPVLAGEKTRAEVARELGLSRNTVGYYVKQFQESARRAAEISGASDETLRGLCGLPCSSGPSSRKNRTAAA